MNYGCTFMTLYRRQESRPSPRKRNAKEQTGCLRRPTKKAKYKYIIETDVDRDPNNFLHVKYTK